MIYIENNSMDASFSFALEYFVMKELDIGEEVFSFWRTTPTLMIGRYQITAAEINEAYARRKNIRVLRRLSGGGTIYTDPGGWQFTFINRNLREAGSGFVKYTAPIIRALKQLGVDAYLSDRNDLLINGKKFSGNAQHRDKNCMLHHGSILFDTDLEELVRSITVSDDKIVSKGIQSIRQRVTNVSDYLPEKISPLDFRDVMLASMLGEADERYVLTDNDKRRINQIADELFRNWEWNYGKSPDYEIVKSRRFGGGKVEVCLNLQNGRISDAKLFGDFFFLGDMQAVIESLKGCRYRSEDVRSALSGALAQGSFFMITLDELVDCIMQ